MSVAELCVSSVICGAFMILDVRKGKQPLLRFFPDFLFFGILI
jgi:hypothetical protein